MVGPILRLQGVSKRFGPTWALKEVHWELAPGRIHALLGANGAGKSTLVKILAGAIQPDQGTIFLQGQPVRFTTPWEAIRQGVATVYQELSGIGPLSVAENLFLGRQGFGGVVVRWQEMYRQAAKLLQQFGVELDPRTRLDRCPLAVQQVVEIIRAVDRGAKVLLLDEPTSALSTQESQRLFELLRRLADQQVAVVLVTHFLEEALSVADQVMVLRQGQVVLEAPASQTPLEEVVQQMLGSGQAGRWTTQAAQGVELRGPQGPVVLRAQGLWVPELAEPMDLEVRSGELLGLFGTASAGHLELAEALALVHPRARGTVKVLHRSLRAGGSPARAIGQGVMFLSGNRSRMVNPLATVAANATVAALRHCLGWFFTPAAEHRLVEPILLQVGCHPPEPQRPIRQLSGGNQQKVLVGRAMLAKPRVLILQEPTRGMDIAAKAEVMQLVHRLKEQGVAVVLATTEPELVLAHADHILILRRGRKVAHLQNQKADKALLLRLA